MVQDLIRRSIKEAIAIQHVLEYEESIHFIEKFGALLYNLYENQGKVLIAGNGGSLCDADHFAEELTGFFRSRNRPAMAAISLSQPAHMSCVANDIGFDFVFARAVESLGRTGDVLAVLTTSGNSNNLIQAVESAKRIGMKTVAFLGKDGGRLKGLCDLEWVVEGFGFSDRIQEVHMSAIHIIIESVEAMMLQGSTCRI
ncbi:MAG: SIS domain-containing protein [Chlamydiia bacterium]